MYMHYMEMQKFKPTKKQVPDVRHTNEVWRVTPTKLKCKGLLVYYNGKLSIQPLIGA